MKNTMMKPSMKGSMPPMADTTAAATMANGASPVVGPTQVRPPTQVTMKPVEPVGVPKAGNQMQGSSNRLPPSAFHGGRGYSKTAK